MKKKNRTSLFLLLMGLGLMIISLSHFVKYLDGRNNLCAVLGYLLMSIAFFMLSVYYRI